MDILIGVIVGIVISQVVQHWDAVGPVVARAWSELKGMVGK